MSISPRKMDSICSVDQLREELNRLNIGEIGNYDNCISITEVKGYWRPLEGASPYDGKIGEVSSGTECKVEVNCKRELVGEALIAIREIHPYDKALINVIPLANHLFE